MLFFAHDRRMIRVKRPAGFSQGGIRSVPGRNDFSHRHLSPVLGENVISLRLEEREGTYVPMASQREEL